MTKAELVKNISDNAGITHAQAEKALESVVKGLVENTLVKGDSTTIPGLGTFKKVFTAEKTGRNPKTGEPVHIPAGSKLAFKMSSTLK